MLITKAAADILRDPDAPAIQVAVAAVALNEAVRQGIEVPLDAGLLLWGAVERSPTTSWAADATEAIGLLARRPLVERIMTSITQHDASSELRRVGLDVLAAPRAVTHVTDERAARPGRGRTRASGSGPRQRDPRRGRRTQGRAWDRRDDRR